MNGIREKRPRLTFANVASALALFVAIGGGAAAIGGVVDEEGAIQACYDKKGKNRGEVRLLVKGKCTKKERRIAWGQDGPSGPAGAQGEPGQQGPVGPQGPAGTARAYAQVNAASTVSFQGAHPGFTSVERHPTAAPGRYCLSVDPSIPADAVDAAVVSGAEPQTSVAVIAQANRGVICAADQLLVETRQHNATYVDFADFNVIIP